MTDVLTGKRPNRQGGRRGPIEDKELVALRALITSKPEITLKGIADAMAEQNKKRRSLMAWSKAIKEMGYAKIATKRVIAPLEASQAAKATHYRAIHRREPAQGLYPSSLTDYEWEALAPLVERSGGPGRPPLHDRRLMWDAVFYLVRGGSSWRMLPADYPSYKAVFAFFARARDSGLLEKVYECLHAIWRKREQRDPQPSAGSVDSQSVKTTEKGGAAVLMLERR